MGSWKKDNSQGHVKRLHSYVEKGKSCFQSTDQGCSVSFPADTHQHVFCSHINYPPVRNGLDFMVQFFKMTSFPTFPPDGRFISGRTRTRLLCARKGIGLANKETCLSPPSLFLHKTSASGYRIAHVAIRLIFGTSLPCCLCKCLLPLAI